MTAVLRFAFQNHPVLQGDLLISAPSAVFPTIPSLPTVDEVAPLFSSSASPDVPVELVQKIAIVSEELMLG